MPRFATFPGWLLLAVGACATATGAPRHAADAGAAADARAEMDEREVGAPARGFEPGPLWGPLRSGPYGVGYRSWLAVDESRGAEAGATGRPIEFMLWYPAAPSDGEPLAFGAYFEDAFPDDWTAPYRRALAERDWTSRAASSLRPPTRSAISCLVFRRPPSPTPSPRSRACRWSFTPAGGTTSSRKAR
jgi:hypothetical protein